MLLYADFWHLQLWQCDCTRNHTEIYIYKYVNISWILSTVFVAINYGALTHIKDIAKRHLEILTYIL